MSQSDPPAAGKPGKKPIDPARLELLAAQLKSAVKGKRPRRLLMALLLVLLFAVPVGLVAWFFWPKPPPPELEVVAFDQVWFGPQDGHAIQARLGPKGDGDAHVNYPACEVYVEHQEPAPGPGKTRTKQAEPAADGALTLAWPDRLEPGRYQFQVRYLDHARGDMPRDDARVWVKPPQEKLLLVDVHALTERPADFRKAAEVRKFSGVETARAALAQAQKAGYFIVYLASAADTPRRYFRVRDWVQEQTFPEGPVLYRAGVGSDPAEREAFTATVAALKKHFTAVTAVLRTNPGEQAGPMRVVTVAEPERDWEALGKAWAEEK
jgi:hypothetical protein